MSQSIKFFLNFEPNLPTKTHQVGLRAGVMKNGKPFLYKDTEYKMIENQFDEKLMKFRPKYPLSCPIELHTIWCFNSNKENHEPRIRLKKPDTDNLVKLLKDRMTKCGYWKDDSLVAREFIEKLDLNATSTHGVLIIIKEIEK